MTLAGDPNIAPIEEAIRAAELAPAPGVLTGYVLLTEWAASDGETYLVQTLPDDQAYWRTLGMLEGTKFSIRALLEPSPEDES